MFYYINESLPEPQHFVNTRKNIVLRHFEENDIMSAEEKNAAAKQTYSFLAPLTNEQPCEAGRWSAIARIREWTGENTFL